MVNSFINDIRNKLFRSEEQDLKGEQHGGLASGTTPLDYVTKQDRVEQILHAPIHMDVPRDQGYTMRIVDESNAFKQYLSAAHAYMDYLQLSDWPGQAADINMAEDMSRYGYSHDEIKEAIALLSPETVDKSQSETTQYLDEISKAVPDLSMTTENIAQKQIVNEVKFDVSNDIPFQKTGGPYSIQQEYSFDEVGHELDVYSVYQGQRLLEKFECRELSGDPDNYSKSHIDAYNFVAKKLANERPEYMHLQAYEHTYHTFVHDNGTPNLVITPEEMNTIINKNLSVQTSRRSDLDSERHSRIEGIEKIVLQEKHKKSLSPVKEYQYLAREIIAETQCNPDSIRLDHMVASKMLVQEYRPQAIQRAIREASPAAVMRPNSKEYARLTVDEARKAPGVQEELKNKALER